MSEASYWLGRPVLVTGGASFIGSHLVDRLVGAGANVRVADDLSSGRIGNIARHVRSGDVSFEQADLCRTGVAEDALRGADTVFHLAAVPGCGGDPETHQSACAENLLLDAMVLRAAARRRVSKVVYASSADVYPISLQQDPGAPVPLAEPMVGPPYEPDGLHGWAKLTGELTLSALHHDRGMAGVACRYFGVYGPRCSETHALVAIMARVLSEQDPVEVFGDGEQVRGWCFVEDIVEGTLRAAERIGDASAVNLGTAGTLSVLDAARSVMAIAGCDAEIELQPGEPNGPPCRCGDFARAHELLEWSPAVAFERGLRRTLKWYRHAGRGRARTPAPGSAAGPGGESG